MKSFNGRVAAITGAASGMGRSLALALAREGCHLALADKNSQGLEQTLALIRTSTLSPVTVTTQVLDVSDRQAMHDWAARCAAEHGQVNLVFNNAGVALSSTVEGVDYTDLEWIVGINFWEWCMAPRHSCRTSRPAATGISSIRPACSACSPSPA